MNLSFYHRISNRERMRLRIFSFTSKLSFLVCSAETALIQVHGTKFRLVHARGFHMHLESFHASCIWFVLSLIALSPSAPAHPLRAHNFTFELWLLVGGWHFAHCTKLSSPFLVQCAKTETCNSFKCQLPVPAMIGAQSSGCRREIAWQRKTWKMLFEIFQF